MYLYFKRDRAIVGRFGPEAAGEILPIAVEFKHYAARDREISTIYYRSIEDVLTLWAYDENKKFLNRRFK